MSAEETARSRRLSNSWYPRIWSVSDKKGQQDRRKSAQREVLVREGHCKRTSDKDLRCAFILRAERSSSIDHLDLYCLALTAHFLFSIPLINTDSVNLNDSRKAVILKS